MHRSNARSLERKGLFLAVAFPLCFGTKTIVLLLWGAIASRVFLPTGVAWTRLVYQGVRNQALALKWHCAL